MSQLRRLAKIYYIVGKYRLDNLIDKRRLPRGCSRCFGT